MAAVLQDWVSSRLNTTVKWSPEDFGEIMKDGTIIAQLLHSYGLITEEEVFTIKKSPKSDVTKKNWMSLSLWLKKEDINIDTYIPQIVSGDRSVLLKIFYQLFLNLDKRDREIFIKNHKENTSNLIQKMNERFRILPKQPSIIESEPKPSKNRETLTDWHRQKSKQIEHTFQQYRSGLSRWERKSTPYYKIQSKDAKAMSEFEKKHALVNYTYEQLKEMQKHMNYNADESDDEQQTRIQNYVTSLKKLNKIKKDKKNIKKAQSYEAKTAEWNELNDIVDTKPDYDLAKCVMKLSQFEKKSCTQLMEMKQKSRNVILKRIEAERLFNEERDRQFQAFLSDTKKEIELQEDEYSIEKEKQKEQHRKLYAKKKQVIRDANYRYCYDTLQSILDFAIRLSYTKSIFGEVSECCIQDWKQLFLKGQPVFKILEHMKSVIEFEIEPEDVICLKQEKRFAFDPGEFWEYHNLEGDWNFEFWDPRINSQEEMNDLTAGSTIIAHVIYTLLHMMYPISTRQKALLIPNFASKAILVDLKDLSMTIPIQALLKKSNIHVVLFENAIKFCLHQFKKESSEFMKVSFKYKKTPDMSSATKLLLDFIEVELDKHISPESSTEEVLPVTDKQTQTPDVMPGEMMFSSTADLGHQVHEMLSAGETLTDHIICKVLAAYIKSLSYKGFVLVNYPTNFKQAQELEEVLTGCKPKFENEDENIEIDDEIEDPNISLCVSKLYHDPHKSDCNETYFTSYIKLKETENIKDEDYIWDLTKENSEVIERFYADKGVNYSLYYSEINKDLLATVCRFIIGDFSSPFKDNFTLFGDIYNVLDIGTTEGKNQMPKSLKSDSKKKLNKQKSSLTDKHFGNSNIFSTVNINRETTQESIAEQKSWSLRSLSVDTIANPGDADWIYAKVSVPESSMLYLGKLWEETEKAYIDNLSQLFFSRKLLMNTLMPYVQYIKEKIYEVIGRPNYIEMHLGTFVDEYNNVINHVHLLSHSKSEWICKLIEIQKQLRNICDVKKVAAETVQFSLIHDNWSLQESNALAHIYVSCMQSELDRYMITLQILQDFYLSNCKSYPMLDVIDSFHLMGYRGMNNEDRTLSLKSVIEREKGFDECENPSKYTHCRHKTFNESNNPYYSFLESNVKLAMKKAQHLYDYFISIIEKETSEIMSGSLDFCRKDDSFVLINIDFERENAFKCLKEWSTAIKGELKRLHLRLQVLLQKAIKDLKILNYNISSTFAKQQEFINTTYLKEINGIENICGQILCKIEKEKPIRMSSDCAIVFDDESDSEVTVVTRKIKSDPSLYFKMGQLRYFMEQLKIVAPEGFIESPKLTYVFQDFLLHCREKGNLPKGWLCIEPEHISKVIKRFYGDSQYTDWRDLLIFLLRLEYPDVDVLLKAKEALIEADIYKSGTITMDQFKSVELWNEITCLKNDDKCSQLKKHFIRVLLFEAMKFEDRIEYLKFLYYFCKHEKGAYGFGKAVCVAMNSKIGYETEWIKHADELIIRKLVRDKEHEESIEIVYQYIKQLVNDVIIYCSGIIITEEGASFTSTVHPNSETVSTFENDDKTSDLITELSSDVDDVTVTSRNMHFTVSTELIVSILIFVCPWIENLTSSKNIVGDSIEVLEHIADMMSNDADNEDLYLCKFLNEPFVNNFFEETITTFKYFPFYEWVQEMVLNTL